MSLVPDLKGTTSSTFSINKHNIVWVPVRQTVLTGRVDTSVANHPGNALSAGTGLNLTLNASSTDVFRIAFADGFNSNIGQADYIGQFTSNQTLALAANTTHFVYVNRASNGALTLDYSTTVPFYSVSAPASPATDQHWFDLTEYRMKRWSGSEWQNVVRVFVGEATTNSSAVVSAITYAYCGRYESAWTYVIGDSTNVFNHNLGCVPADAPARVSVSSSMTFDGANADIVPSLFAAGDSFFGWMNTNYTGVSRRTSFELYCGNYIGMNNDGLVDGAWATAGYYKLSIQRTW